MNAVEILVNLSINFARMLENIFSLFFIQLQITTFPISIPFFGGVGALVIDLQFTPIELILGAGLPIMIGVLIIRMLNPIT